MPNRTLNRLEPTSHPRLHEGSAAHNKVAFSQPARIDSLGKCFLISRKDESRSSSLTLNATMVNGQGGVRMLLDNFPYFNLMLDLRL